MRVRDVRWSQWNIDHIAGHGVDQHEVEEVVYDRSHHAVRVAEKRYLVIGPTPGGRHSGITLEREGQGAYFVVTARDAELKERRLYERHRRRG